MAKLEMTIDYEKNFDPQWYLATYYGNADGQKEEGDFLKFMVQHMFRFFNEGKVTGSRLLDIGTGPSVHSIISASDHVDSIYLSDYATANRKVLNDWWKNNLNLEVELFQFILDLQESGKSVQEKQDEMRQQVQGIFPIDVTRDRPLEAEEQQFDIVVSSLCLEAASQTLETYRQCAKNITPLLKTGGHLLIVGVLNQTFYRVGNFNFSCCKLSSADVKQTYIDLGYRMLHFETMEASNREENTFSDFEGVFIMLAKKVETHHLL